MPLDRPQKKNVDPSRPLMPRLAAGASSKSPQPAPKLAQNFTSNGSPLVWSPIPRHDAPAPRLATHPGPSPTSSPSVAMNVTPRSAARKTRANSSLSTPNTEFDDTPPKTRPLSVVQYLQDSKSSTPREAPRVRHQKSRSEIQSSLDGSASGLNVIHPTYTRAETAPTSPGVSNSIPAQAPSFFYANEASASPSSPQRPPLTKKPSSFLYADGMKPEQERTSPYNLEATSPRLQQSPIQSSASIAGRNQSPQRQQATTSQLGRAHRDTEPIAYGSTPSLPSRRQSQEFRPRKASVDSGVNRSQPIPFTTLDRDPIASLEQSNTIVNGEPRVTSPGGIASPVLSSPSIERVDAMSWSRDRLRSIDVSADFPQSPSGMSQPNLASYSEIAANARRERKVMDLEISNSSLLAINRSLEREVRRQKLEIRRFRRISRRSYSSFVTDSPSEHATDALSELAEESEDEADEDNDIDDFSENDSLDEDAMSPAALAESDERHLLGDQKRLHLDLHKHKELLIDSQKMNQAMRRCLGVTEQLIKDGEKALQYRVLVSDIDFGGRVLSPEEQEDKNPFNAVSEAGDMGEIDRPSVEEHEKDIFASSMSPMSPPEASGSDPFNEDTL